VYQESFLKAVEYVARQAGGQTLPRLKAIRDGWLQLAD
jgi:hypothetical protein